MSAGPHEDGGQSSAFGRIADRFFLRHFVAFCARAPVCHAAARMAATSAWTSRNPDPKNLFNRLPHDAFAAPAALSSWVWTGGLETISLRQA